MRGLAFLVALFILVPCPFAAAGSYQQAMQLRQRLSLRIRPQVAGEKIETIRLPISPGLSQEDSNLCWVYATLSLLETNYLVSHPGQTGVQFSRAALQYSTMRDRFLRWIGGEQDSVKEGGIPVDALDLIRQNGLIQFADYHDIVSSTPIYQAIHKDLLEQSTPQQKLTTLDRDLQMDLSVPPMVTHLAARQLSPSALATEVLQAHQWVEFDVSKDGRHGWGPSLDPEARLTSRVYYTSLTEIVSRIRDSLRAGQAVAYGANDHVMLIYGAQYNKKGKPLVYYIKDSFPPYTFTATAEALHEDLTDVTVTVIPK